MINIPFSENEKTIRHETSVYNVALDGEPEYAAKIGVIISMFALIEDYAPRLLQLLTGMSMQDSHSTMAVFRAFSNRIDLLKAIYKPKGEASKDAILGSHYVGLFTQANAIRNKYAHATYSTTNKSIILTPFSSDYNRPLDRVEQTLPDFDKDLHRLRRIICELHALVWRSEIPQGLHKQLQKQGHLP